MHTGTSHLNANRRYGLLGSTLERIKRFFNAGTVIPSVPGDPGELRLSVVPTLVTLSVGMPIARLSLADYEGQES
jgi:hypothetical protein